MEAGKHTLIEIPIAMSLAGAERVVAAGERSGLVYGLSHPMRFRREREALRERVAAGQESIRHIAGRFFIPRLVNIGATGLKREWTDNILWHHFCHFVDLGLYLFDGAPLHRVQSHLGLLHPTTGIPMECVVLAETEAGQSLLVHGSYHASYRLYEPEQENAARVTHDFLAALRDRRAPRANGPSILPAMRVLQQVQDDWDARYGAQPIPGRR